MSLLLLEAMCTVKVFVDSSKLDISRLRERQTQCDSVPETLTGMERSASIKIGQGISVLRHRPYVPSASYSGPCPRTLEGMSMIERNAPQAPLNFEIRFHAQDMTLGKLPKLYHLIRALHASSDNWWIVQYFGERFSVTLMNDSLPGHGTLCFHQSELIKRDVENVINFVHIVIPEGNSWKLIWYPKDLSEAVRRVKSVDAALAWVSGQR